MTFSGSPLNPAGGGTPNTFLWKSETPCPFILFEDAQLAVAVS